MLLLLLLLHLLLHEHGLHEGRLVGGRTPWWALKLGLLDGGIWRQPRGHEGGASEGISGAWRQCLGHRPQHGGTRLLLRLESAVVRKRHRWIALKLGKKGSVLHKHGCVRSVDAIARSGEH